MIQNGDFEDWNDLNHLPTGWYGSETNIGENNVTKVESDAYSGNTSVRLTNTTTSHKRFTSQSIVNLVGGAKYTLTYRVKGTGEIRNAFYDDDYSSYTAYTQLNSSDWKKIQYTFTLGANYDSIEIIFSVRNTSGSHIQIDNVVLEKEKSVAQIGSQYFYTLQEAVNAVADNGTIQLLENITLTNSVTISNSKNFTLDLNGKTLSSNSTVISHNGSGKLKIMDSSGGNGKITSDSTNSTRGTIYLSGGTAANTVFEIIGGTIENSAEGNAIYNGGLGKILSY